MWNVRVYSHCKSMAASENSSPSRNPSGPRAEVLEQGQHTGFCAERRGCRRCRQELVGCAELVAFEMGPANPAETLYQQYVSDRLKRIGEQVTEPSVEQQRFVVSDQVRIEGEPARGYVEPRANPMNTVGYLVNSGRPSGDSSSCERLTDLLQFHC
jgi:hypothetical protein